MARNILNIGHRGFSLKYPENTLVAFRKAIEAGADGFECDVRITKDDEIVVFHDDNLKRLCGQDGSIEEMNWTDLMSLQIFGKERVCRLEDVLSEFPDQHINLEIKVSSRVKQTVERTFKLLREIDFPSKVLISSFSFEVLDMAVRWREKEFGLVDLGYIFYKFDSSFLEALEKRPWLYSLHPHFQLLKELPSEIQLPLWTWTPNTRHDWKFCMESKRNIEALITDNPYDLESFLKPS